MFVCRPNAVFAGREKAGTVGRAEEVDSMQRKIAASNSQDLWMKIF